MIPVELIIAAGCLLSGTVGFFACAFINRGHDRNAERRAIRQMERLHRARAIQDLRDSTRLF